MLAAAAILAVWVAERIEAGVLRNSALATALYVESFLSVELQELATDDVLSSGAQAALEAIFVGTPLGDRVKSYKIWMPGGRIVAARDPEKVGQIYGETQNLLDAWQGEVRAEFEDLGDAEDAGESLLGIPLLEIYSPVRADRSDRIIAVAEFYEAAPQLRDELAAARRNTMAAVFAVTTAMGALLFGIVLRGSRTIARQRGELEARLSGMSALAARNATLRTRIQRAAARSSALHEQTVRRIGADLHDGPAQLLAFAALRLETLRHDGRDGRAAAEFDAVDRAVKEAVKEIRTLSRGLTLPDLEGLPPCRVARDAVEAHMARSGQQVHLACDVDPEVALPDAARICVYRFIQEGLNNVWKHAGPDPMPTVTLSVTPGLLVLAVADRGEGFPPATEDGDSTSPRRIGLAAMRDRVESLGGTFSYGNRASRGAEVRLELEL